MHGNCAQASVSLVAVRLRAFREVRNSRSPCRHEFCVGQLAWCIGPAFFENHRVFEVLLSGTGNWTAMISNRCLSSPAGPEGNNLVVGVMPNVGASQPWNSGPPTPVTDDLFLVHAEIGLVRSDIAAAAKHDARHAPDLGVAGDVK